MESIGMKLDWNVFEGDKMPSGKTHEQINLNTSFNPTRQSTALGIII